MDRTSTRIRVAIAGLVLSFLFCYLEWGKDQSGFFGQMEYDLIFGNKLSSSITHPLIFLPLAGELLLLYVLFQKQPNKKLVRTGILLLGTLVGIVLLVGILAGNPKIIVSTLPFLTAAVMYFLASRKQGVYQLRARESKVNGRNVSSDCGVLVNQ